MLFDNILEFLDEGNLLDSYQIVDGDTTYKLKDAIYFNLDGEFTTKEDRVKNQAVSDAIIMGKPYQDLGSEDFIDSIPPFPNMVLEITSIWDGMYPNSSFAIASRTDPHRLGSFASRVCIWLVQTGTRYGAMIKPTRSRDGALHLITEEHLDLVKGKTIEEWSQIADDAAGRRELKVLGVEDLLGLDNSRMKIPFMDLIEKIHREEYDHMRAYSMMILDFESSIRLTAKSMLKDKALGLSSMSSSQIAALFGPLAEFEPKEYAGEEAGPPTCLATMLIHFYQNHNWAFDWSHIGLSTIHCIELPFPNYLRCLANGIIRTLFKTISIINCTNVELIDIHPAKKRQKSRRKKGKLPLVSHKTLQIKGKKSYTGNRGKSNGNDTTNRVHLCRGHFKSFTDDNPLFGKYTGRYWWQPQVRGDKQQGLVVKNYQVDKENK